MHRRLLHAAVVLAATAAAAAWTGDAVTASTVPVIYAAATWPRGRGRCARV